MKYHLVEIEKQALQALNAGRSEEAAKLFEEIVTEQPDWEHGTARYSLAGCYEDMGNIGLAEQSYREALQYEPENPIFIGGLASFLYLHGDPEESFKYHLALRRVYRDSGDELSVTSTEAALKALSNRMGWAEDAIASRLDS